MKQKFIKLIDLKTIITILLTVIFCILVMLGKQIPTLFEEIYRMVVLFYFGTQFEKMNNSKGGNTSE